MSLINVNFIRDLDFIWFDNLLLGEINLVLFTDVYICRFLLFKRICGDGFIFISNKLSFRSTCIFKNIILISSTIVYLLCSECYFYFGEQMQFFNGFVVMLLTLELCVSGLAMVF